MRSRFTLVELMVVVAIVMVLAAIAVPEMVHMQMSAKRAELMPNVDGIQVAQVAYEAANGAYISTGSGMHPADVLGKSAVPWTSSNPGFVALAWAPDGNVRGRYVTNANLATGFTCPPASIAWPTVFGVCGANQLCSGGLTDVDVDGTPACVDALYNFATKVGRAATLDNNTRY